MIFPFYDNFTLFKCVRFILFRWEIPLKIFSTTIKWVATPPSFKIHENYFDVMNFKPDMSKIKGIRFYSLSIIARTCRRTSRDVGGVSFWPARCLSINEHQPLTYAITLWRHSTGARILLTDEIAIKKAEKLRFFKFQARQSISTCQTYWRHTQSSSHPSITDAEVIAWLTSETHAHLPCTSEVWLWCHWLHPLLSIKQVHARNVEVTGGSYCQSRTQKRASDVTDRRAPLSITGTQMLWSHIYVHCSV